MEKILVVDENEDTIDIKKSLLSQLSQSANRVILTMSTGERQRILSITRKVIFRKKGGYSGCNQQGVKEVAGCRSQ